MLKSKNCKFYHESFGHLLTYVLNAFQIPVAEWSWIQAESLRRIKPLNLQPTLDPRLPKTTNIPILSVPL